MNDRQFEKISRALSDVNRITILNQFKTKKRECLHCSEVIELLDLTQPSISHHLKQLVEADLLLPEKEGRHIKYTLNREVLSEYINCLSSLLA